MGQRIVNHFGYKIYLTLKQFAVKNEQNQFINIKVMDQKPQGFLRKTLFPINMKRMHLRP